MEQVLNEWDMVTTKLQGKLSTNGLLLQMRQQEYQAMGLQFASIHLNLYQEHQLAMQTDPQLQVAFWSLR